ncbi:putative urea ABC transporter substrate-binding protein [Vibrio mangrovi]|uniref:Alkanesulfonate transporter substrate-binding subunit n=1 Tax=Vibrio mangrovi TaxID=474394 RepID=A0A1Y6J0W9_9VIBR|nr:putative urea ABC transporter substrate-binding protein [Vibrio mangrovi]MDW6002381.1 putative urea ABC transporter substrate-binding protein [Vibrio mangrovi]SMS02720.1 alkanesulfonate transporter substrate-binding subunit [Vibrio mangrovi]
MKFFLKPYLTALALSVTLLSSLTLSSPASAEEKSQFTLAWSIYVGWMPWDYADSSGILKKWADKYGIKINVVQVNDYVESINQYTAGQFDATVMTNMDALTIPAASGVDSTALIVGDFSDGNDGIILKGDHKTLADIKGQNINLVELSVSHYLMARALEAVGLSEQDVHVVNTSDADIVAAYQTPDVTSVVTWNPLLSEITALPKTSLVFNSAKIPGEIIDLLVANTKTLQDNPKFAKALTGAWYEVMSVMNSQDKADAAKTVMAKASGTDLAGYNAQLQATRMFFSPADAVQFTDSVSLMKTMQKVAQFSFDHGLLGEGAPDATFIGIETPAGVYGNSDNIRLRFNPAYMKMAAEHKL